MKIVNPNGMLLFRCLKNRMHLEECMAVRTKRHVFGEYKLQNN